MPAAHGPKAHPFVQPSGNALGSGKMAKPRFLSTAYPACQPHTGRRPIRSSSPAATPWVAGKWRNLARPNGPTVRLYDGRSAGPFDPSHIRKPCHDNRPSLQPSDIRRQSSASLASQKADGRSHPLLRRRHSPRAAHNLFSPPTLAQGRSQPFFAADTRPGSFTTLPRLRYLPRRSRRGAGISPTFTPVSPVHGTPTHAFRSHPSSAFAPRL
jgi:hypothetical protein